MRPAVVVVRHELSHDVIEVRKSEDDEVIEGLVPQTLNPRLDEGVEVRRSRLDRFDVDAAARERPVKFGGVLRLVVSNDGLARQPFSFRVLRKGANKCAPVGCLPGWRWAGCG